MQTFTTPTSAAQWLRKHVKGSLQTDSRKLQPGDGFIAWPGAAVDARHHVTPALLLGATACLVERNKLESFAFDDVRVAAYPELKAASGPIAAAYFEEPAGRMDVLAVTGTNGKTSTAWWLAQALTGLSGAEKRLCAMVGTLGVGLPPHVTSTGMTTPDPVLLQQKFREFVDQGVVACAIEASSIGVAEKRLNGTPIRTAIFTNFTQDHLDYHKSMDAYWQAKQALFQWPGLQSAVINLDDPMGSRLAVSLHGVVPDVWTVTCQPDVHPRARLVAREIGYDAQGLNWLVTEGAEQHRIKTRLIGTFNVSNLLGVMAAMRSLGVPLSAVVEACHQLTPVPGRMECFGVQGQPLVAVDYAHTPDALDKALETLRSLTVQRNGKLWCVFGCGGDRDAGKRPLMGATVAQRADQVVVTSDNPRSENPQGIIEQILGGMPQSQKVNVQADRALAIAQTVAAASPHDVILVAGKGHEDYQEVAGVKRAFSDITQVKQALSARTASQ